MTHENQMFDRSVYGIRISHDLTKSKKAPFRLNGAVFIRSSLYIFECNDPMPKHEDPNIADESPKLVHEDYFSAQKHE